MQVTKDEIKESTKHSCGYGCCQRNSAEREEYGKALIAPRMTETNDTNAATTSTLMERIASRANLNLAYKRVVSNKGAAGVDRMAIEELKPYLMLHAKEISQSLKDGTYKPSPVRRVEIPKDNGKKRKLGIPTVCDRVIQQAIMQVLTGIYEPEFVETSYGFRPNRSCHSALQKGLEYLNQGYVWTVDMDLEKFFDTVNQSKLIEILSKTIKDGQTISLIHRFMRAGAVWCNKFEETSCGVPQGGPLSPILANIMLNELDHELEKRGHKFVRYADDMVIFCKSKASAIQTLEHIIPYIEKKLFLKVNREKTVVAYASKIKFLGYGVRPAKNGFRLRVHSKSKTKLENRLRDLTARHKIRELKEWKEKLKLTIYGWINYYKLADMWKYLENIDEWLRRRIRMVFWKRWKRVRTKYENLKKLGISHDDALKQANTRKGYWRTSRMPIMHKALSNDRLERNGFVSLLSRYKAVKA